MLPRTFYLRSVNRVAPELLRKLLVHDTPEGTTSGIIVEVEAYDGKTDKGAHSYPNKRAPRTEIQFGPGGFAYVYAIYGMHNCFNVVTGGEGDPQVALVRALEPVDGLELMTRRRNVRDRNALCSGPGKLCQALGITKAQYGVDLCISALHIEPYLDIAPEQIMVSPPDQYRLRGRMPGLPLAVLYQRKPLRLLRSPEIPGCCTPLAANKINAKLPDESPGVFHWALRVSHSLCKCKVLPFFRKSVQAFLQNTNCNLHLDYHLYSGYA